MIRQMTMVLVALCAFTTLAHAAPHGNVQTQGIRVDGSITPRFTVAVCDSLIGPIGFSFYGLSDRNWSESYIGPTYAPQAWVQVGLSLGEESGTKQTRIGSFAFVAYRQVTMMAVLEDGASGRYVNVDTKVAMKRLSFGWLYDNILGGGPEVMVSLPRTPFSIWASAQRHGQQLSLQYSF